MEPVGYTRQSLLYTISIPIAVVRLVAQAGHTPRRVMIINRSALAASRVLLSFSPLAEGVKAAGVADATAFDLPGAASLVIYLHLEPGQQLYALAAAAAVDLSVHVWDEPERGSTQDGIPSP